MKAHAPTRRAIAAGAAAVLAAGAVRAQSDEIHVRSVGRGPRVWVLLHPYSASGKLWESRAAALAEQHGITVLSPDLPSHGRSRIVEHFSYDASARAVAAALGGRPVPEIVVGASSGGIVAMKLAAHYRRPVVGIGVGDAFSSANIEAMRGAAQAPDAGNDPFATSFREQGEPQRRALRRHLGQIANAGTGPLLTAAERQALEWRTVIVNGARDDFFNQAQAHALAESIPGSVLSFLTGAGHLEPLAPPRTDVLWSAVAALATRHRA